MKNYEKLRIIKRLSGMTQEKLAQMLNVSFATLNSWINERSQPHKKKAIKIDELYKKYTGQTVIPRTILVAKKKVLFNKSKKHTNLINVFFLRSDIYNQFMLSLTYNSNSIEGSTLSENETADILFNDRAIKNKSLTEQLEAKNHQAAFEYLLMHLHRKGKIDESLILRLHTMLMNGIRDDAGFYRRHSVRILGSNVPTANYIKVPDLMREVEALILKRRKDTILHVTEVHARFEKIHPFSDGNGRIGRLLMTAMLIKANLPPAIILQETKQLYYTYLKKAQLEEDLSQLEDFISDAVLNSFDWLDD